MIRWSDDIKAFFWTCAWGCSAFDFESSEEAEQDFLYHSCAKRCP